MKLDFIEIGTADFETLVQKCSDTERGISVEPIKVYLDKLPNKKFVKKVNAAIVADESLKSVHVYFIHENDIINYGLGGWLKGCNSVGKPHDFHVGYYPDPSIWHKHPDRKTLPKRDLLSEGIVTCLEVPCMTFKSLMLENGINYVEFIKIDTEGQDSKLLNSILDFYEESGLDLPKKIVFETNAHNNPDDIKQVCVRLSNLGYQLNIDLNNLADYHDCIAEL